MVLSPDRHPNHSLQRLPLGVEEHTSHPLTKTTESFKRTSSSRKHTRREGCSIQSSVATLSSISRIYRSKKERGAQTNYRPLPPQRKHRNQEIQNDKPHLRSQTSSSSKVGLLLRHLRRISTYPNPSFVT